MFSSKLKFQKDGKLLKGITNDIIDIIAYDSNELIRSLDELSQDKEKLELITAYLKKADKFKRTVPDFDENVDWFNVFKPFYITDDLQGKVVIVYFWSYGCTNSLQMLSEIKKIEAQYPVDSGVAIIGVHTPMFENEKESANIQMAIREHKIGHPILNDRSMVLWEKFGIPCWPTLLVLGVRGNPILAVTGKGHSKFLQLFLKGAVTFYTQQRAMLLHPLPVDSANKILRPRVLCRPSKIACFKIDEENEAIYAVSDSGNHRVLVFDSTGQILHRIGCRQKAFVDGNFRKARFNTPLGITFSDRNTIFVADSKNHAIRKIDLYTKAVSTVVGNGEEGKDFVGGNFGVSQQISSPWDVLCYRTKNLDMSFHIDESKAPTKKMIFIAMTGLHQIWALFLEDTIWWKLKRFQAGQCVCIAGTGSEMSVNNAYPRKASFAQPAGLSFSKDAKELYVCDSETSIVRRIQLTDGRTSILPTAHKSLMLSSKIYFESDDPEPPPKGGQDKLNHPLAITYNPVNKLLYVADTQNDRIKQIDSNTNSMEKLSFSNVKDDTYYFNKPEGMCVHPDGEALYVCNTRNSSIERINLTTMAVEPVELFFVEDADNLGVVVDYIDHLFLTPEGGRVKLKVKLRFENEMQLMEQAPQQWKLHTPNEHWQSKEMMGQIESTLHLDLEAPSLLVNKNKDDVLTITFKMNVCLSNMCIPHVFSIKVPIHYSESMEASNFVERLISVIVNTKTDILVA